MSRELAGGSDPARTPRERVRGTGIGLAIVKKAAERMGGTTGVESVPGEGSTFWIELLRANEWASGTGTAK